MRYTFSMREHSKPGEGILSPRWHKKLENLLFTRHTTLSIIALSSVFISSLILDGGLRSFVFDPIFFGAAVTDIWWLAMPFIAGAFISALIFLAAVVRRSRQTRLLHQCAALVAATVLWLTTIEYILEWSRVNGALDGFFLPLSLYYVFSSFIVVLVTIREPHSIFKQMNISTEHSVQVILITIAFAVTLNVSIWYLLGDSGYTWAYAVTAVGLLWPAVRSVGMIKD